MRATIGATRPNPSRRFPDRIRPAATIPGPASPIPCAQDDATGQTADRLRLGPVPTGEASVEGQCLYYQLRVVNLTSPVPWHIIIG
jgi:hypothetical protein